MKLDKAWGKLSSLVLSWSSRLIVGTGQFWNDRTRRVPFVTAGLIEPPCHSVWIALYLFLPKPRLIFSISSSLLLHVASSDMTFAIG